MVRRRSLLIVNHHSASLARQAVTSARLASSVPLQIIIVDNSCDAAEADSLRLSGADHVIVAPRNLGYGGAINLGRIECSADVLVISNPDVVFAPGSIDHLVDALRGPAVVAGPRLTWDRDGKWLLPPADDVQPFDVVSDVIESRVSTWHRYRDAARAKARLRFWTLDSTATVPSLSGAVLAVDAQAFDDLHGFDERYFLYFEEHDFLRRVTAAGGLVKFVPEACCRHLYNQSARSSAAAARHFAESEERFLRSWLGPSLSRLALLRRPVVVESGVREWADGIDIDADPSTVFLEASPLADFRTAAGHLPASSRIDLPDEIWSSYRDPVLYFRTVNRSDGRTLSVWKRARGLKS